MDSNTNTLPQDMDRPALALAPCSVWIVICEHNRYGEYISGIYDNLPAATAHKQFLDGRIDGWENLCGGEIRQTEVHASFTAPNS